MDRLVDTEALRKWRRTSERHLEVLLGYGVPREDATRYADLKTSAELGPRPKRTGFAGVIEEMEEVSASLAGEHTRVDGGS